MSSNESNHVLNYFKLLKTIVLETPYDYDLVSYISDKCFEKIQTFRLSEKCHIFRQFGCESIENISVLPYTISEIEKYIKLSEENFINHNYYDASQNLSYVAQLNTCIYMFYLQQEEKDSDDE